MEFPDDQPRVAALEAVNLLNAAVKQQAIANLVDESWYSAAGMIDHAQGLRLIDRVPRPASAQESMADVGSGFCEIQGVKMARSHDALL
jgi:hypothetical protein